MEDYFTHTIYNYKYRLELCYSPETKVVQFLLLVNTYNAPGIILKAELPPEVVGDDVEKFLLEARKHRKILIDPKVPTITLLLSESHELKLTELTESEEEKKQVYSRVSEINYGVVYWNGKWGQLEIKAVFDPHHQLISLCILVKARQVTVIETTISKKSLLKKSSPLKGKYAQEERLGTLMTALMESTVFNIQLKQKQKTISTNHQLIGFIPISTFIIGSEDQSEYSQRVELFKHIFLTELITHMIIHRFGRQKSKSFNYRDGYESKQYKDEELEELRSLGHRFNEFRDHPLQKNKKMKIKQKIDERNKQNCSDDSDDSDSSDESNDQDESDSSESQEDDKQINIKLRSSLKLKKMQKVRKKWKVIRKKMRKFDQICNFSFLSGKQKSKINKTRYCLHQMTRETDKTEALINFVQFAFKVYAKEDLVGDGNDKDKKKEGMAFFLSQFKVKRQIQSCFQEYTRQSFFHKILNVGLRVLKNPEELVYLRLPFSHIFWSIKIIYQRHKRAIFNNKAEKNKNRTIQLYRGFEIKEKELKRMKKSIGDAIEIEGFISTSRSQSFQLQSQQNYSSLLSIK